MAGRILILDDVATNRIVLKVRLEQACYDVVTATSLAEAFHQADRQRPNLILFTTELEGRNPVDILHALAEDPATGDVPAIAMTAPGNLAARAAALAAGAADALSHPLDEQLLLARLRALMRESGQADLAEPGRRPMRGLCAPGSDEIAPARIALIAADKSLTAGWRRALAARLDDRLLVLHPEAALAETVGPRAPELFLIAADLTARSDGLRLMSELRARPGSRDAAFCIALDDTSRAEAAVALDLGADEVLPLEFTPPALADEAALRIRLCLLRQARAAAAREDLARRLRDAVIDPLTGLTNRRGALPRLEQIAQNARMAGHDYAVLAIDLDHFKRINDSYGHAAGDAVLAEVAGRMARTLPGNCLIARMGGEEFIAVLPDASTASAQALAQLIRHQIGNSPICVPAPPATHPDIQNYDLRQSCSIGVALSAPDTSPALICDRADRALLSAKSAGRDRVTLWQTDPAPKRRPAAGRSIIGARKNAYV